MPKIQAATVAEHRARQRRAILDAARAILAEGGSESPSLAAVAARTGLARSSIYQYFKSSADLLDAVIVDMFPRWSAYVARRMRRATTPGDQVFAYVAANLHLVAKGEHAIVRGLATTAPVEILAERSRELHNQLRVPLLEALAGHGTPDPVNMAELIQAIVFRASRMIEDGMSETKACTLARELLEPYLRQSITTAPERRPT
ncbi:helix-turn-helix domain-containing protein [Dactylosporangium sp. NPDC049140]|uniref:TetR/AcrR family transcriptional regulator n=1 Tax=Dactylosporangium sp. NPDC049140 TaxID=3155647 RepID=UPI00340CE675